jgi:hypothetical protein
MTKEQINALFDSVRSWPEEDQEEFIRIAREIEARRIGSYHATPDELQAIDQADRSSVAAGKEVEATFKTFHDTSKSARS